VQHFIKSLHPQNIVKAFRISGSVSGFRLKAVFGYPYPVANSLSCGFPAGKPDSDHLCSLHYRNGAVKVKKSAFYSKHITLFGPIATRNERTVKFCDPDPVLIFENSVQVQPQSKNFFKCKVQVQMKSNIFFEMQLFHNKNGAFPFY